MVVGLRDPLCQIACARAAFVAAAGLAGALGGCAGPAVAQEGGAPAPPSATAGIPGDAAAEAADAGPTAAVEITGREVAPQRPRPAPAEAPVAVCSFTEPVCVHAGAGAAPGAVAAVLAYAEGASRAFAALGLPRPLPDLELGGGPAFDVYLVDGAEPVTSIDLGAFAGRFDRASAFAVLPPPPARHGCEVRAAVARALAEGIVLGLDAGAEQGAIGIASTYLAALAAPCAPVELAAVDELQRRPEREITGGAPGAADGAFLFAQHLDETYGTGRPGRVITGLLAVAAQRTPPGSLRWQNEPDVFDALRDSLRPRGATMGDLLLDFGVSRAFVGSRSDGAHLGDVARFGDAGRVRFEWAIPFGSLPRRLAPLRPISSTGMTYLWLDLSGSPAGAELTFVADWELPVMFRWALVKVDRAGAEAGRVDVAGIFGATHAERTVVGLEGLAGLLVVGVNVGDIDRQYPFDPDDAPFEPHGYTVTLAP